MVTIKDVAKAANVSIATVSAVINRNKYVSEPLKHRVEKAIEELGYRPNKVARSLKKKETGLIGVIVTEITNPFYPRLLKGVEDAAITAGYNVLLCTTGDDPDKEYELVQSMVDQGVDGIVLGTVDQQHSQSLAFLNKIGMQHVLVNRSPEQYAGTVVRINSFLVGELAATYLTELGHRNIAFIGGDRLNSWEREKAFIDTLSSMGIYLPSERVISSEYSMEKAYQDIQPLIKSGHIPSAIFTASDVMAFGAIKALQDAGYRIPHDVSVIGSDNIPFAEDFRVSLTSIDAKAYDIGRNGCELLISAIQQKDEYQPAQLYLEPVLIERESCRQKE
ncbi:LacI family DNA-binding transcriptional regulator [Halalkalibacter oceani]|uniref:LacI family DNA-binding transcriptional regulator n=1 Tax=Halalkalibacter oceani TaxID=1653776 RepID=UPI0033999939